jgi:type IV/VI secretion system ImpK/VasF family protein
MVQAAMQRSVELGLSPRDAADVGYVLAALIDEAVLTTEGPARHAWAHRLLQLVLFQENVAGEGVFRRLDELVADATRTEVLEVYYLALLHGFRGRYAFPGGEAELERIVSHVESVLRRQGVYGDDVLSPSAARPDQGFGKRSGGLALRVAIASISLAVVGCSALSLHGWLAVGSFIERVDALHAGEAR